jgi:hypothetical protein
MCQEEVQAVLEAHYEEYQDRWNMARFTSFVQASSAGAKLNKPEDMIKFSWDEIKVEKPDVKVDVKRIQEKLMEIINTKK